MASNRKIARSLGAVAVMAMALAACSSQGGAQNQAPAAGGGGGDAADRRQAATPSRWSRTSRRVTRSGTRSGPVPRPRPSHGITLKYSNNEQGPEQATLVQNAIDSQGRRHRGHPVQRGRGDPGGEEGGRRRRSRWWRSTRASTSTRTPGRKMYFGSDELLAGQTIGQTDHPGGRRQDRCASSRRRARSRWRPAARASRRASPTPRTSRSTGLTCPRCSRPSAPSWPRTRRSPTSSPWARRSRWPPSRPQADTGQTKKVITFDLNQDAAKAIQEGKIEFSIDQQPLRAGLHGRGLAVAEPDQRQRHRRRQAGADRPVRSWTRPTSTRSCPTPPTTPADRAPGGGRPACRLPRVDVPVMPSPGSIHEHTSGDEGVAEHGRSGTSHSVR